MTYSKLFTNDYWNWLTNIVKYETNLLLKNNGFTYSIPKEEQIRIWIHNYLKNDYPIIEVESDLFIESKVIAEYDLRIIWNEDFLIEIKRWWTLVWWQNKYWEFLESWKKDIDKLILLSKNQNNNPIINPIHKKSFILVVFWDKNESMNKFKLQELSDYSKNKWWEIYVYNSWNIELENNLIMNVFIINNI